MFEWLVAGAVLLLFLALLPLMLRWTKPRSGKRSGGSGVMIGIGLVIAMIFDPRAAQAIEAIDKKQDEREDEESGDQP